MALADLGAFGVALVAYNNLLNLWRPFRGPLYVPLNLSAAGAAMGLGFGPMGLAADEIGLQFNAEHLLLGISIGVLISGPLLAMSLFDRTTHLIADRRVAGLEGRALAYQTLVRVPLGTALVEEILFRGVLFAGLRQYGVGRAAILSALVFGLWHISPTWVMVRENRPGWGQSSSLRVILGAVILTFVAGVAVAWLRDASGDLSAPFAAHAVMNSLSTFAGVMANRRIATSRAARPRPHRAKGTI